MSDIEDMLSDTDNNISVQNFVCDVTEKMYLFIKYWDEQNNINPLEFPDRLNIGDWYEMFLSWVECVE